MDVKGGDDKCGIPIGFLGNPVEAVSRSTVKAIVPQNTEVVAADHDVSILKLTPSVVLSMNIGEDPGDFLFGGGAEGNGQIFVALHDAIFKKSDCYHHVAMTIGVTRNTRIKWLVEDG